MMTYLNVLYSHKAMEIATRKGRMKSVERKEGRININDSSFFSISITFLRMIFIISSSKTMLLFSFYIYIYF